MHPQAFQGRVIGAPMARTNIPCEALRAGLQFLKRPPPLLPAPSQLLPLTPGASGSVSGRPARTPKGGEGRIRGSVTVY